MRRRSLLAVVALGFVGVSLGQAAEPVGAPVWIRNDVAAAQAEARKTGKPIFVTFRCEA